MSAKLTRDAIDLARHCLTTRDAAAAAGERLGEEIVRLTEVMVEIGEVVNMKPVDVGRLRELVASSRCTPAMLGLQRAALALVREQRPKLAKETEQLERIQALADGLRDEP